MLQVNQKSINRHFIIYFQSETYNTLKWNAKTDGKQIPNGEFIFFDFYKEKTLKIFRNFN